MNMSTKKNDQDHKENCNINQYNSPSNQDHDHNNHKKNDENDL